MGSVMSKTESTWIIFTVSYCKLAQASNCWYEYSERKKTCTMKQTPRKRSFPHLLQAQLKSNAYNSHFVGSVSLGVCCLLRPLYPSSFGEVTGGEGGWGQCRTVSVCCFSGHPQLQSLRGVPTPVWVSHRWGFGDCWSAHTSIGAIWSCLWLAWVSSCPAPTLGTAATPATETISGPIHTSKLYQELTTFS